MNKKIKALLKICLMLVAGSWLDVHATRCQDECTNDGQTEDRSKGSRQKHERVIITKKNKSYSSGKRKRKLDTSHIVRIPESADQAVEPNLNSPF
jgi:hypothetical protein